MLKFLSQIPARHSFAFGVAYTGFKGAGVDLLVQTQAEGKPLRDADLRRLGLFTLFNASFTGAWQYLLFVRIMGRLVPDAAAFAAKPLAQKLRDPAGMRNLVFQNFLENGVNNPFLYFPTFYTFQAVLDREDAPLQSAWARYRENFYEDVPAILSVWVPAQFINFGFSPMWFRVPFVATVSAFWTGYVSITRGASQKRVDEGKTQADGVEGASDVAPQSGALIPLGTMQAQSESGQ